MSKDQHLKNQRKKSDDALSAAFESSPPLPERTTLKSPSTVTQFFPTFSTSKSQQASKSADSRQPIKSSIIDNRDSESKLVPISSRLLTIATPIKSSNIIQMENEQSAKDRIHLRPLVARHVMTDDTESVGSGHKLHLVDSENQANYVNCGCGVEVNKRLACEALPSLMFSVIGLMLAGTLLDHIQHWRVFEEISELIIMVPVLLNLKGNLEMNLAARVSTAANLGQLDERGSRFQILSGNLLLMQIQGIVVGTVAGLASVFFGICLHGTVNSFTQTMLMLACSITTASVASFCLGSLMCGIVVLSRFYHINPDNIATPLAASLGDLVTLVALSGFATALNSMNVEVSVFIILMFFGSLPWLIKTVIANKSVAHTLKQGWTPLFISMLIASFSGMVLEQYIAAYDGMALLSPVINGIAGNLGAIFSSRIATSLHGELHENLFRTMTTLFIINVPIQSFFLVMVHVLHMGHVSITWSFAVTYLICTMLLLSIVLSLARKLCFWMWERHYDPHNYVLPFLTSIGDVSGTLLIVLTFALSMPDSIHLRPLK